MKKTLSLILLCIFSTGLFAQVRFIQTHDLSDYETVLETVKQQDKLLWVAVYEEKGDFQKMFFNNVFKDKELIAISRAFTNVAINVEAEMGLRYQEIFAFDDLPAFLIMNKDEFVLAKLDGYQKASDLRSVLNEAARKPYHYDSLLVKYQAHSLNQSEWIDLLELYALNFDFNRTSLLALEYLNAYPNDSLLQSPSIEILAAYGVDIETPYPALVLNNLSTIKQKVASFNLNAYQAQAMDYNLDLAIQNKDAAVFTRAMNSFLQPPYCPTDSAKVCQENFHRLYAYKSGNFSLYHKMIQAKADAMAPILAANYLFEEAYEITEDYNSEEAKKAAFLLAKKSDEKQTSFKARMLMTYSQYLLEDFTQARIDLNRAKELIANPEELESFQKLEKLIEKKE